MPLPGRHDQRGRRRRFVPLLVLPALTFPGPDVRCSVARRILTLGILTCTGTPLGYLYTNESYTDFTMTFQYRWPNENSPGKGGILIRTTGPDKIWPKSLEAQINANSAGDFWALDGHQLSGPANRTKSLTHDVYGKLTNIQKIKAAENPPGQWNSYKIIADGPDVTLIVNGRLVNKATRSATTSGRICITSEGTPIEFKNIILTPK